MGKNLREELYKIIRIEPKDSSQYLIAKEILYQINFGYQFNIREIAKITNSSKPTVTRFGQNFGFYGFKDFIKELLIQEKTYYFKTNVKTRHESFKDYHNVVNNFLESFNNEESTIIEISKLIQEKQRIFIFSSSETILAANSFADKLRYLGIKVFNTDNPNNQFFLVKHDFNENDIALFLVSGFDNDTIIQIWNYVNEQTTTVLISTLSQKEKFQNSDYSLILNLGPNALRVQLKPFLLQYLLDQISNILIYSDQKYLEILTNPTYKL